MYAGIANSEAMLDLWAIPVHGGRSRRLTSFSRDTYAPSVTADGSVAFKVQSYRTFVAIAPADGGATQPLATFQSETPSWHPDGKLLGITYGTWRRVVDDANYPDIAQDVGIIAVDARATRDCRVACRPQFGVGRSIALLVAERKVDRVSLPQGSVGRHLVARRGRQRARHTHFISRARRGGRLAALVSGRQMGAVRWRQPHDASRGCIRGRCRSRDGGRDAAGTRGRGARRRRRGESRRMGRQQYTRRPQRSSLRTTTSSIPSREMAATRASCIGSRPSITRRASRCRRMDGMSPSSRGRTTVFIRCSGCRSPGGRRRKLPATRPTRPSLRGRPTAPASRSPCGVTTRSSGCCGHNANRPG